MYLEGREQQRFELFLTRQCLALRYRMTANQWVIHLSNMLSLVFSRCFMMTDQSTPDELAQHYSQVLLARAMPLFEQAAQGARDAGLHAEVHTSGNPTQLYLQVRSSEHGYASHYLIQLDSSTRQIQHQLFLAADGTTRRLPGGVDSINSMVLDTQLATLFREGFGMTLPAVEQRHPAGFW